MSVELPFIVSQFLQAVLTSTTEVVRGGARAVEGKSESGAESWMSLTEMGHCRCFVELFFLNRTFGCVCGTSELVFKDFIYIYI